MQSPRLGETSFRSCHFHLRSGFRFTSWSPHPLFASPWGLAYHLTIADTASCQATTERILTHSPPESRPSSRANKSEKKYYPTSTWSGLVVWSHLWRPVGKASNTQPSQSVSDLTIGVEQLFYRRRTKIEKDPLELLGWMCRRSQPAPGRHWNLTHLTLIEGVYNCPSNPLHLLDARGYPTNHLRPKEDPKGTRALVRGFPMISGLRSLRLVLAANPGADLLKRLSEKCSAHGINFEFVVREPWLWPVPTKMPTRTPA